MVEFQETCPPVQMDGDLTKLIIDGITSDNVIEIKERVVKAIPKLGEKK